MHALRPLVAALLVAGTCHTASAQTLTDPSTASQPIRRGDVGFKAGLNHEQAEDGLKGTSGAGGVVAGIALGRAWTAELELWVPGYLRDAAVGIIVLF